MGYLISNEETYLMPDGKTITFSLSIPSVELFDEDGEVACHVLVTDERSVVGHYFRRFPLLRWNEQHLENFIRKCIYEPEYLTNFTVLPCNKVVPDKELEHVVREFERQGSFVLSSCRGTTDELTDKAYGTDGHANRAFIRFEKVVPWLLLDYIRPYKYLSASPHCITVTHRKHNPKFVPTMEQIVAEWGKLG